MKKRLLCVLGVMILSMSACGNAEDSKDKGRDDKAAVAESDAMADGKEASDVSSDTDSSVGCKTHVSLEEVLSEENIHAKVAELGGLPVGGLPVGFDFYIPESQSSNWQMGEIVSRDADKGSVAVDMDIEVIPGVTGKYFLSVYARSCDDGKGYEIHSMDVSIRDGSSSNKVYFDTDAINGDYAGQLYYNGTYEEMDNGFEPELLGDVVITIDHSEEDEYCHQDITGHMTITKTDGTVIETPVKAEIRGSCFSVLIWLGEGVDVGKEETIDTLEIYYDSTDGQFKPYDPNDMDIYDCTLTKQ